MVLIPAACGGRAQLETFEGQSLTGSTGAGGGSSSSSDASSSSVSSSSVSSSASSVVSTSTGSSICEIRSQDCNECVDCTLSNLCMGALDACFNDAECVAFNECLQNCVGDQCFDQCGMMHPEGLALYLDLIQCVFCFNCPNICADQVPPEFCDP